MSEEPEIVRSMFEAWQDVNLLGGTCTAFIARAEDLRALARWLMAGEPAGVKRPDTVTTFHGVQVITLDVGQAVMAGHVMVVRSEDLDRVNEAMALAEDSPIEIVSVFPDQCWVCAIEGNRVPRSD